MNSDAIWNIGVIVWFVLMIFTANWWSPLAPRYRFSRDGIDIMVLYGAARQQRIRRQDIRSAEIMSGLQARWRNPFAWNLGGRLFGPVLLIKTDNGRAYMLTPRDPKKAVADLGLGLDSHPERTKPKEQDTLWKKTVGIVGTLLFGLWGSSFAFLLTLPLAYTPGYVAVMSLVCATVGGLVVGACARMWIRTRRTQLALGLAWIVILQVWTSTENAVRGAYGLVSQGRTPVRQIPPVDMNVWMLLAMLAAGTLACFLVVRRPVREER